MKVAKVLLGCEGLEHKVVLQVLVRKMKLPLDEPHIRQFGGDEIWRDDRFVQFIGGPRNREGWTKVILLFDDNQRGKVSQKASTVRPKSLAGVPICVLFIRHMDAWVKGMLNPSDAAELDRRPRGQRYPNMAWAAGRLESYGSINDRTSVLQELQWALQCQCKQGHHFLDDFRPSESRRRPGRRQSFPLNG